MTLQDTIKTIPLTSGVYLMKDADGKVIYVGKAVSLRKRVQSYFRKASSAVLSKTDLLVSKIKGIDHIETASEAEALILEASLIKKYDPKFNIDLRDDKSYPYIVITDEEYPRIMVDRPHQRTKGWTYYGPYVNPRLIREALKIIRRIFYFRLGSSTVERERLDHQIGLSDAPSHKDIDRGKYIRNIKNVCLILEGKTDALYRSLRTQMETCAKEQRYEEAAKVRDQLQAIGALYSGTGDINYYKEAEQLQRALSLPRCPERIETFDISNIMGNQAVGSMVSFLNGKSDKNNYRRFRIKEVGGIDDFRMIAEIIRRRYRRLKEEGLVYPDLIVIDGGKGQLSAACAELEKMDIAIPVVSLAKKEEEIFLPGKRDPVRLSPDSLGLRLLQRTRDEAHRFAVKYHRMLRGKNAFGINSSKR